MGLNGKQIHLLPLPADSIFFFAAVHENFVSNIPTTPSLGTNLLLGRGSCEESFPLSNTLYVKSWGFSYNLPYPFNAKHVDLPWALSLHWSCSPPWSSCRLRGVPLLKISWRSKPLSFNMSLNSSCLGIFKTFWLFSCLFVVIYSLMDASPVVHAYPSCLGNGLHINVVLDASFSSCNMDYNGNLLWLKSVLQTWSIFLMSIFSIF